MISLDKHVGTDLRSGDKVEHDQLLIRKDGVHIGYVGTSAGCKPTLLPHARLSEADEKDLLAKCEEATRAPVSGVTKAGEVKRPPGKPRK